MSRADEAVKVGAALKTQLSRLSQLESESKKLTEDNSYLRQPDLFHLSLCSLIARLFRLQVTSPNIACQSLKFLVASICDLPDVINC